MQVTETVNAGLAREYKVVVPWSTIEGRAQERFREIRKNLNLPGFRPGKVPMPYLKRRYWPEVGPQVLQQTIEETTWKTMEDRQLLAVSPPTVEVDRFDDGQDLEYTMKFEIVPDIPAISYEEIEIEREVPFVREEDVDEAMINLARSRREYTTVEGRPAGTDDMVVLDHSCETGVEGVGEGFSHADWVMRLDGNSFLPGFTTHLSDYGENLIGAETGERRDFKMTVPEEFEDSRLQGKEVNFSVLVKEIREPGPEPSEEELASQHDCEEVDELRQKIREHILSAHAPSFRGRLKERLFRALADKVEFELPPVTVEKEFEMLWSEVERQRERDTLDDEDKGKSEEELRKSYSEAAEHRVRTALILLDIARKNDISVAEQELNAALTAYIREGPGLPDVKTRMVRENPEFIQATKNELLESKVVDFILELANVTSRDVPLELDGGSSEKSGSRPDNPSEAPAENSTTEIANDP